MFPSLLVGYKADGSLFAELIGAFNQRITLEAPSPQPGHLQASNELLHSLCDIFARQSSVAWRDVVSFFAEIGGSIPGARLNLGSYLDLTSLPPISEDASIIAYQHAADLLAYCQTHNLSISPFSMLSYVEKGVAQIAVRAFKSAACLIVTIHNDTVTDLAIYPANPFDFANRGVQPLLKQACCIEQVQSETTQNLLLDLTRMFYDTFKEPIAALRTDIALQRARLSGSPLATAITSLGSSTKVSPDGFARLANLP